MEPKGSLLCSQEPVKLYGKGKAKLSLCLTKHHATKTYWGSGGIVPHILDFTLDGGEWSASWPSHFTPRETAPGIHWIGPSTN
jgi:hypothetical protein